MFAGVSVRSRLDQIWGMWSKLRDYVVLIDPFLPSSQPTIFNLTAKRKCNPYRHRCNMGVCVSPFKPAFFPSTESGCSRGPCLHSRILLCALKSSLLLDTCRRCPRSAPGTWNPSSEPSTSRPGLSALAKSFRLLYCQKSLGLLLLRVPAIF